MFRGSRLSTRALSRACFGQARNPLMAFLAYIDCSGDARDPQAKVISVAGYIAHEDQWARFEEQWTRVLDQYGVPALHMKEFSHSVKGSAFETWKGDNAKRNAFMAALTDVVNDCNLQVVSTTLVLAAYEDSNRDLMLREAFGAPYAVATLKTVAETVAWHKRHAINEPLLILLEKGDNEQSSFSRLLERLGEWNLDLVTQPVIQRKQWKNASGQICYCVPFQAADFISYEHGKMFTDRLAKGKKTVRESVFKVSYPANGDAVMSQLLGRKWVRDFATHFKVTPRFNRPSDGVSKMPTDPLCYLNMEQPLVSTVNPESWSTQAPRAVVEAVVLIR